MADDKWEQFERRIDALIAAKKLRLKNPYVLDLIWVLRPHAAGLRRPLAMHLIEKNRKQRGLPVPRTLPDTVQSAFQQYCENSDVFKKRKAAPSDALFYWPQGKGAGVWAVHPERAEVWLREKLAEK